MNPNAVGNPRPDWNEARGRIDLAAVATNLLGPAPGRRGERGRRLWWPCPFHDDRNPSFVVDPGKAWWKCWGCGASGDAASLVMRLEGVGFPAAVARLTDCPQPLGKPPRRHRAEPRTDRKPPAEPSGMPEADALALVEDAAARLWTPAGAGALSYLTGPDRALTPETVRAARLGWTPGVAVPKVDGTAFRPFGVVIPWFTGGRLALVKVRQPDGRRPKYAEAFRDPARLVCYPNPDTVRPGRPLVIVEGEFDALCLGEALGELAAVVTLGSASARPTHVNFRHFLAAAPWFLATDADPAGDRYAAGWPARARRVRPPLGKDWTEAKAGGVDLSRWWRDILSGMDGPRLFTWNELARWRWGPARGDHSGGIGRPQPATGTNVREPAVTPEGEGGPSTQ